MCRPCSTEASAFAIRAKASMQRTCSVHMVVVGNMCGHDAMTHIDIMTLGRDCREESTCIKEHVLYMIVLYLLIGACSCECMRRNGVLHGTVAKQNKAGLDLQNAVMSSVTRRDLRS